MTEVALRVTFGAVGGVLIAAGFVVGAVSEPGEKWFSGPMVSVGIVAIVIALAPKWFQRDR